MLLPYDLHTTLLGVRQAAELAMGATDDAAQQRRNEARIRAWKTRGHLKPTGADDRGRPTFLAIDVLHALARTTGADPRLTLEQRRRYLPRKAAA